ncbi:hypothetical protein NSB1T_04590 [Coprobacter fastidiosus NSB1 = JCM 33896]|nr:hypothetical protein NSB1T_04590 [Coprobacter fastidiosus NSB1 = JCM 33896]
MSCFCNYFRLRLYIGTKIMIPEAIMTKKTRKLTSPYPLINK